MSGEEFFKRFIQHIPPRGMHRLRRYGLLSGRIANEKREQLKRIISCASKKKETATQEKPPQPCRACKSTDVQVFIFRRNPNALKNDLTNVHTNSRFLFNKRKENDTS